MRRGKVKQASHTKSASIQFFENAEMDSSFGKSIQRTVQQFQRANDHERSRYTKKQILSLMTANAVKNYPEKSDLEIRKIVLARWLLYKWEKVNKPEVKETKVIVAEYAPRDNRHKKRIREWKAITEPKLG